MIEEELVEIKDNAKTDGMMIGAYGHEAQEGIRDVRSYVQRVHKLKGLIKASGYIDTEDVEPWEWLYWDYAQRSHKDFDLRRLDGQLQAYKEEESKRSKSQARIHLPSGQPMEEEEEEEEELRPGDTATVRLDSGEVVNIPMEYLQPREPESEVEDEEMEIEPDLHDPQGDRDVRQNPSQSGRAASSSDQDDPTRSQATWPNPRWTDLEPEELRSAKTAT